MISYIRLAFLLSAVALFGACRVERPQANGLAIVALDPVSGEVGAAGASCSDYPFDYRAALVPGLGAIAQLGIASPLQRDSASAWVEQPQQAPTIVARLVDPENDPDAAERQYAIVTVQEDKPAASVYLGARSAKYKAAVMNEAQTAAVAGAGLASRDAAEQMLAAFEETTPSAPAFSDRLMRALEAGSAAGGLGQCNVNGVEQTATSAFVMQARKGDPKFQVNTLGHRGSEEPAPPYLTLSVNTPRGGANAVHALREEYGVWRAANLPACAECSQAQIRVPEGGTIAAATDAGFKEDARWLVAGFVIVVMAVTMAYFAWRPREGRSVRAGE